MDVGEKYPSKKLKDLEKENPKLLTISPLDSHLDDVTFTNFRFRAKMTSRLNSHSAVIRNCDFLPDEEWQKDLSAKLGWPFQFNWIGPEELGSPVDYEDIVLIFASGVKPTDNKDFTSHFEGIFKSLQQEYPGKVVLYPAYRKDQSSEKEICLTNKFDALEDLEDIDKELSLSYISLQVTSDEDKAEALDQEETDTDHESQTFEDDQETFQVVKSRGRKKTQQYSELCKFRSKCGKGLKCTHRHTEAEKKFFKKPRKRIACRHNPCTRGPPNCDFAHAAGDSFCQECHQWGHLQDGCKSKLS